MSLQELQTYYKTFLTKESPEGNAVKEARSEGHDAFESAESAGMKRANKILEAIKRKDSYKESLENTMEKGFYPQSDWMAIATAKCQAEGHSDFHPGKSGQICRDKYAMAMQSEHGVGGYGRDYQLMQKQFPPALASLMSAAAGWAFSGDVGKVGQMTDQQAREWERTLSAADRRKMERSMRSKMRRKSVDKTLDKSSFDSLKEYYADSSDEYIKRSFERNDFLVQKDHSVLPPRQGLMWDAVKHRWTRPENVGHTVTEVQGKKRFRGVGTGAHERSVSGHGSGKARQVEAGRRFKSTADVGVLKPHENKRPAGHAKHKKV